MLGYLPFEASPQPSTGHKFFGIGKSSASKRKQRKTSFRFKAAFDTKPPTKMHFYSIQVAPQADSSYSSSSSAASTTTFALKSSGTPRLRSFSASTHSSPKWRHAKNQTKHVTFNEAANTEYCHQETGVCSTELWFSKQEVHNMRRQFKDHLYVLQAEHKQQSMASSMPSTLKTWYRAYHACTLTEARRVEVYPVKDPNHVGAERLGVSNILQDIASRRHALNAAVRQPTAHPELLAQACRAISLPSRLYAIHVAKASILMESES
jgi:hypothetical protein